MTVSLKFYSDAALTALFASNKIQASQEVAGAAVDKVAYLGSTAASTKFQDDASPGVNQISLSIVNATPLWQASTVYALNDYARTTAKNGYKYQVTAGSGAMTSAASEPTWPTTIGQTVTDGDLTWTCVSKLHESTEITLALAQVDLDTNTPGDPLDLGLEILSGSANAVQIHMRVDDATDVVSTLSELSIQTQTLREVAQ